MSWTERCARMRADVAAIIVALSVFALAAPSALAQTGPAFIPSGPPVVTVESPFEIAFNHDGSLLAVGGYNNTVSTYTAAPDGTLTPADTGVAAPGIRGVAFSPSGSLLAVVAPGANTIYLWPVAADGTLGTRVDTPMPTGANANSENGLAWSPDGRYLAVSESSQVVIYSVAPDGTLTEVDSATASTGTGAAEVAFSPSGDLLAVADRSTNHLVWTFSVDADGMLTEVGATPVPLVNPPRALSFSPDGSLLAVSGFVATRVPPPTGVALFGVGSDGSLTVASTQSISDGPWQPAFSPSGNLLAVGNGARPSVDVFSVGPGGSSLTPVTGSPFAVGSDAKNVAWAPSGEVLCVSNTGSESVECYKSTNALVISKTASPSSVLPGRVLTYTLTLHNPGVDVLGGPVVDDLSGVLSQARFLRVSASVGSASFDPSTQKLTWDGTVDPGQTATVTYSVRINSGASGEVFNGVTGPPGATCSGQAQEAQPCMVQTPIDPPEADLSIVKRVSPSTAHPGDRVTYTLLVRNRGPSDAADVGVRDLSLAGLRIDSIDTPQGSCVVLLGTGFRCRLGTVTAGQRVRIRVSATVLADAASSIENTAIVSSTTDDPNPDNNQDSAKVTVTPTPPPPVVDLAVTKTAEPSTVHPGGQFIWTVTVTNKGPDRATGVTLDDLLPDGVSVQAPLPSQGSCTTPAGGAFRCLLGDLAAGDSAEIEVVATVSASASATVTNFAAVHGAEHDPNPANNIASSPVSVLRHADLSLTKSAAPVGGVRRQARSLRVSRVGSDVSASQSALTASRPQVVTGDQVIYTLAVHNHGPDDATGVKVVDPAPAGLLFLSATPSQGTCTVSASDDHVSCSLGELANGGDATVLIVARVATTAMPGFIRNVAAVSVNEHDPNPANNIGVSTIQVIPPPAPPPSPGNEPVSDLVVTKHVNHARTQPRQPLQWTITVTNKGPDPAPNSVLTDTRSLPVTIRSVHPSRGTCTTAEPLTCSFGTLAVNETVTITVNGTPTVGGTIINTASATSSNWDPTPKDNIAEAKTTIVPDIQIRMRTPRPRFTAGQRTLVNVITTNPNPVTLHHVVTCVVFPAGLSFQRSIPRGYLQHGHPCFTAPQLPARQSRVYTLHAASICVTTQARLSPRAAAKATETRIVRAQLTLHRLGGRCAPPPPAVTG